jgi:CHAT domain-containing protein/tetratricopeptide (TPR) repeat protein
VWLAIGGLIGMAGCAQSQRAAGTPSDDAPLMDGGAAAYDRGRFEDAITAWDQAATRARARGDQAAEADARTSLAAAQMMIGRYDLAVGSLGRAIACADGAGDAPRKVRALNALGAAYTFNPNAGMTPGGADDARAGNGAGDPHAHHQHGAPTATAPATTAAAVATGAASRNPVEIFAEASKLAEELADVRQQASIQINLGNFYARNREYTSAKSAYERAAKLAGSSDEPLACKAAVNGAVAALTACELAEAEKDADARKEHLNTTLRLNQDGRDRATRLPDSHDKAFLLITVGQTAEQIAKLNPKIAAEQRAIARDTYERANAVADKTGDLRSRSYASGYLGDLYLADGALSDAEKLTRRAIMAAQQARLPDSLYRWEWQNARLYRAKWEKDQKDENLDASIRFYAAATQPVQFIRNDISLGHGNSRKKVSFRESIGSLYFEYADMLLRRAERLSDEKDAAGVIRQAEAVADLYIQARSTVEQVKAVELENYFQDECVHLLKTKQKGVTDVDATTAVIYLIPLADRTEILVSFKDKQFFRAKSALTGARLQRGAELLREQISSPSKVGRYDLYQRTAGALYKELIAPIRPELDKRQIKTLVFVPDGPLRMIPMAVLYDGQKHLIEDFAIAITPGLELLEPKPIERTNVQLLASGLSEGREGLGDLTLVPQELDSIQKNYLGSTLLLNQDFVQPKLERAMAARPYSIVHVASHAVFGDDASKSFLLTYDDKMKLDDIERLIRPYQLRDQPVELLTLSACQSAKGDNERAALGLAGIAVKAGARSAVASLWSVEEESSVRLMSDFYAELSRANTSGQLSKQISKAQAMRDAQVKMLRGEKYRHPYYWAPFLVIGNWL